MIGIALLGAALIGGTLLLAGAPVWFAVALAVVLGVLLGVAVWQVEKS